MEFIAVAGSLAALVTLLNSTFVVAKKLSRSVSSDARLKTQLLSFKLEKLTLEKWLKNSALSGAPIQDSEEITQLLQDFEKETVKIHHKLTYYASAPERSGLSKSNILPRIKYDAGGYEELADMILLLEKLNKVLQTIAPPLPPGYDYNAGLNPPAPRLRSTPTAESSSESQTSDCSPAPVDLQDPLQDIRGLWKASVSAASTMALFAQSDPATFRALEERLSIWGTGLFDDTFNLDTLTGQTKGLQHKLAEPLAAQLVDITIEQERIMRGWSTTSTERGHRELSDAAFKVHHFLINTEMTQAIVEEVLYQPVDEIRGVEENNAHQIDVDGQVVSSMVDILFEYLPAINRLRRAQVLRMERLSSVQEQENVTANLNEQQQPAIMVQNTSVSSEATTAFSTTELIDENVKRVQDFEQGLASAQLKDDEVTRSLLRVLSKERERLAECQRSLENGEAQFASFQGQLEVGKMQQQFSTLLEQSSRDILDMSPTPKKHLSAPQEKTVRAMIDSMQSATSHLYGETVNSAPA